MPELPEAETIARCLHRRLRGVRIERVRHVRADMVRGGSARALRRALRDRRIVGVTRRGKRVIIECAPAGRLIFALGMTGHPHVVTARSAPSVHVHLRIVLDDGGQELRLRDARRFGWIEWLVGPNGSNGSSGSLDGLGIEPLDMTLRRFRAVVARPRQIKALLLDQTLVAGLGNIYCDEALYRSRIHPMTRACDLTPDEVARLCGSIKGVLRAAIQSNGSTIGSYARPDGGPGSFQKQHRVYGRTGLACPRCGARIVRILAAGRSSHLCPHCQPPARRG